MSVMQKISIKDLRNLTTLCRVCLTESKSMTLLTEKLDAKLNTTSIYDFLSGISNRNISTSSKYPCFICPMCLRLLRICYEFKLQLMESQRMLAEYYGEPFIEYTSESTLLNKPENCPSVEIISAQGTFDLKDVLIVESEETNVSNYDGFLRNLGTEISAMFVGAILPNVEENTCSAKINLKPESDDDCKSKNQLSQCPICKKIYTNRKLKRHMNFTHYKKQETFVCELCGLFLKTRSRLYHHMVKHEGRKHRCKICSKSYFSSGHLRLHIEAVHVNNRTHLCTICGKNFNYANALTYHMRLHTGEQKYECTYCDRKFTMGCSLKRHLISHTGIRNYKCGFCNKAFKSRSELLPHEMTHTGFKPYHCKYCKKGFIKTHNLKLHLLSHGGQHICDMCNKNFIEFQILKFHMKKAHGCLID